MPSEKPVRPLHTLAYGETAVIPSMYLYAVRGGVVALRKCDAKMILVQ